MPYRIAGIDVHKKMLAVVVSDVEVDGEYEFEHCRFSTSPDHLRLLAHGLMEREIQEVVMESTAQYWKPGVGCAGAVLEADLATKRTSWTQIRNDAFSPSAIESRCSRTQEGFSRCRTSGQEAGGKRTQPELCTRYRTAAGAQSCGGDIS